MIQRGEIYFVNLSPVQGRGTLLPWFIAFCCRAMIHPTACQSVISPPLN
jgi:hypothetical protein